LLKFFEIVPFKCMKFPWNAISVLKQNLLNFSYSFLHVYTISVAHKDHKAEASDYVDL